MTLILIYLKICEKAEKILLKFHPINILYPLLTSCLPISHHFSCSRFSGSRDHITNGTGSACLWWSETSHGRHLFHRTVAYEWECFQILQTFSLLWYAALHIRCRPSFDLDHHKRTLEVPAVHVTREQNCCMNSNGSYSGCYKISGRLAPVNMSQNVVRDNLMFTI